VLTGTGRLVRSGPAGGQSQKPLRPRVAGQAVPAAGHAGLRARIVQQLLALNACIWLNWQAGAPVKRSLIAHGHA
jgi:hypothetical protein